MKKNKKDKPIEDILNKDGRMMRSPVLWFFLLFIPVVLGLYMAFMQVGNAVEPNPDVPTQVVEWDGNAAGSQQGQAPVPKPGFSDAPIHGFGQELNRDTVRSRGVEQGNSGIVTSPPAMPTNPRNAPMPSCEFTQFVGKLADQAMQDSMKATGRPFRILPPNSMVTQDYAPARVNFDLDAGGIVTRVWCG